MITKENNLAKLQVFLVKLDIMAALRKLNKI
jgi:hypothetical protein